MKAFFQGRIQSINLSFKLLCNFFVLSVEVLIVLKADNFKVIFVSPLRSYFTLFVFGHVHHISILIVIKIVNIGKEGRNLVLHEFTIDPC